MIPTQDQIYHNHSRYGQDLAYRISTDTLNQGSIHSNSNCCSVLSLSYIGCPVHDNSTQCQSFTVQGWSVHGKNCNVSVFQNPMHHLRLLPRSHQHHPLKWGLVPFNILIFFEKINPIIFLSRLRWFCRDESYIFFYLI